MSCSVFSAMNTIPRQGSFPHSGHMEVRWVGSLTTSPVADFISKRILSLLKIVSASVAHRPSVCSAFLFLECLH